MKSASNSLPADVRATLLRILAYMGGLAILATAALSFLRMPASIAAFTAPPQPQWIKVDRPHPAFELLMPELASAAFEYSILRRPTDGARKDVLTWGAAGEGSPYVTVEVYRPGVESDRFIDADSEVAARILDLTVTDDVKPAGRLDSKFGDMPLVDFAIAANGRSRRCLGFARAFERPSMQFSGWYCSAGDNSVERTTLGCVLDRLTILSAGGDSELDDLFARAEIKRTFCGQRNPILAATPERTGSIPAPRRVKLSSHPRQR